MKLWIKYYKHEFLIFAEECGECECKTFEATEGETAKCNCGHEDAKHKGSIDTKGRIMCNWLSLNKKLKYPIHFQFYFFI